MCVKCVSVGSRIETVGWALALLARCWKLELVSCEMELAAARAKWLGYVATVASHFRK